MGKKIIFISLVSLLLVSCSNYTQNALLGDYQQPSACPDGGCANSEALPQGLSVSSPGVSTAYFKQSDQYVEFSGYCSVGNYSQNFIKIFKSTGGALFSHDSGIYAAVKSYNTFVQNDMPRCIKGRYSILIDKAYFNYSSPVNLQFRMMGCESDCGNLESSQWVNPGSAQTSVKVVCSESNVANCR